MASVFPQAPSKQANQNGTRPLPAMILIHQAIQDYLNRGQYQPLQAKKIIHETLLFSKLEEPTLETVILDLKQRTASTQGRHVLASLELFLIAWAIQHRLVTQSYAYRLLNQSLHFLIEPNWSSTNQAHFSQIILCARFIAKNKWQNKANSALFSTLAKYASLTEGVEIFAHLLYLQDQPKKKHIAPKLRPLPRKLLLATLAWPSQDHIFPKVIQAIENHPLLEKQVREHATGLTEQNRLLTVKESLLLVGPKASRELILVAHFHADLTQPYFPLRDAILQKQVFLSDFIKRLTQSVQVNLPCHEALLAYLWVYDFWYHPEMAYIDKQLPFASKAAIAQQLPPVLTAADWYVFIKPYQPTRALKLIRYWQLSEALIPIIQPHAHKEQTSHTTILAVCSELAHLACASVFHFGGQIPALWQGVLQEKLKHCGINHQDFVHLMHEATYHTQIYSPLIKHKL